MAAKRRPQAVPDEDDADTKRARRTSEERRSNESGATMRVAAIRPVVSSASALLTPAVVVVKESPSIISSSNDVSVTNNNDNNPRENSFLKSTRKAILTEESTTNSASTTVDAVICSVPTTSNKSLKDKSTTTMSKVSHVAPSMLFFLFVINLIAIAYITTQRTQWQSLIHMKRETELYRLKNELAASQNEVRILQVRLELLEQMWVTDDNDEENDKLLLGSEWGLSNNPSERVTTMDERNLWMEKIRILESEKEYVLTEFRKNLSVSQDLVKALKQCQIQDGG